MAGKLVTGDVAQYVSLGPTASQPVPEQTTMGRVRHTPRRSPEWGRNVPAGSNPLQVKRTRPSIPSSVAAFLTPRALDLPLISMSRH
jgi:hypothetical protein